MKVLFLGLLFCEESLEAARKYSTCGIQYAPHKFQKNLIDGMKDMDEVELTVLNVPPTGSFPIHSKELFSKKYEWENGTQIAFVNVPFLKHLEQKQKLLRRCRKIIKQTKETVHILVYSPYPPFLNICEKLKKEFGNVKCCLILTDPVPGRGDLERFMTPEAKKKGDRLVAKARAMDSFIVLTEHLAQTIEVGNRPYDIVECICDAGQKEAAKTTGEKHKVLYSGTLEKEYGILDVAEAFTHIPDAEFWIYGLGNAAAELEKLSQQHSNIKYFGFADQTVIAQARDQSDYLINPRRPTGTFTKYSFPSKTAEYMVSGKPVIMYKLEGVPDEYDGYLNYLTAETPEGIAGELKAIFKEDYSALAEKGRRGRVFAIENKCAKRQAEKTVALMK